MTHTFAQFCATTRHMASCDWLECVSGSCGDTLQPTTTHHVTSCGTKLCTTVCHQHYSFSTFLFPPPECAQLLRGRVKIEALSRVYRKFPRSFIQRIFTLASCPFTSFNVSFTLAYRVSLTSVAG